jgi:phosphoribosyl-dephospho-CoA transferase
LIDLAAELAEMRLIWGVTGSVGFALATGIRTMRRDSDLDLLIRAPRRISRDQAAETIAVLECAPVRVDVQVETAHGAFALAEWAAGSTRVLLKSESGPILVDDPWQCESIRSP